MVLDKRNSVTQEQKVNKTFTVQEAVTGRFIRISFAKGTPAVISEVKVGGVIRE